MSEQPRSHTEEQLRAIRLHIGMAINGINNLYDCDVFQGELPPELQAALAFLAQELEKWEAL